MDMTILLQWSMITDHFVVHVQANGRGIEQWGKSSIHLSADQEVGKRTTTSLSILKEKRASVMSHQ